MNGRVLSLIRFDSSTSAIDGKQINRNYRINIRPFSYFAKFSHFHFTFKKKRSWNKNQNKCERKIGITDHSCFFFSTAGSHYIFRKKNYTHTHTRNSTQFNGSQFQLKSILMLFSLSVQYTEREPLQLIFFLCVSLFKVSIRPHYMGILKWLFALEDSLESDLTSLWYDWKFFVKKPQCVVAIVYVFRHFEY